MLDESSSEKANHVLLTFYNATAQLRGWSHPLIRLIIQLHPNHAEITVSLNLGHPGFHDLHPPAIISDDHHVLPFPLCETHFGVGPVRAPRTKGSSRDQTRSILPRLARSCRMRNQPRMPFRGRSKEDPTTIDVSSLLPVPLQGRPGVWKGSYLACGTSPDRVMITM